MADGAVSGAPISLSDFAKWLGVSTAAVSKAVTRGRLSKSVVRVGGAPKLRSYAAAEKEWNSNTNAAMSRRRRPPAAPSPRPAAIDPDNNATDADLREVHENDRDLETSFAPSRRFAVSLSRRGAHVVIADVPSERARVDHGVDRWDSFIDAARACSADEIDWADVDLETMIFEMAPDTAETLAALLLDAAAAIRKRAPAAE